MTGVFQLTMTSLVVWKDGVKIIKPQVCVNIVLDIMLDRKLGISVHIKVIGL